MDKMSPSVLAPWTVACQQSHQTDSSSWGSLGQHLLPALPFFEPASMALYSSEKIEVASYLCSWLILTFLSILQLFLTFSKKTWSLWNRPQKSFQGPNIYRKYICMCLCVHVHMYLCVCVSIYISGWKFTDWKFIGFSKYLWLKKDYELLMKNLIPLEK